ncbi:MAG: imidazoleglycerol-phosphate dehydratase [Microbacterium sp.]|nr:imidazoleglycerol-phosphate dehydratase [Microbacterium sp.]
MSTESATPRTAEVRRATSESQVELSLDLDGDGTSSIDTSVPFFDHMLTAFAKHSLTNLTVRATGDTHIDAHHTVEDVAIVLGQAIRQALGDKAGISRYGDALVPLDEALAQAVVDISGRPYLVHTGEPVGYEHHDPHHIAEAEFKAFARAFRQAKALDPLVTGVPSTKGAL